MVAGEAKMPRRQFTPYNPVGAALCSIGMPPGGTSSVLCGSSPCTWTFLWLAMVALSLMPAAAALVKARISRHRGRGAVVALPVSVDAMVPARFVW